MPRKRVVIVDDQHEVRRMLHAWMETLRPAVEVLSMPSAEEALLEAARKPVDLLIADIRLPGITGFELKDKIQRRYPDLKVILITGVTDPRVRKQVATAGAYAFFIKPIDMPDFLDAAERALGLVETMLPAAPIAKAEKPAPPLESRLRDLRAGLKAEAAVVLTAQGQILEQAGNIPGLTADSPFTLALLGAFHASTRVSDAVGAITVQSFTIYKGPQYDLVLVPLGPAHCLALALPLNPAQPVPAEALAIVYNAFPGLMESLDRLEQAHVQAAASLEEVQQALPVDLIVGKTAPLGEPTPAAASPAAEELSESEISELESLFQGRRQPVISSLLGDQDLETFWDTAADEAGSKAGSPSSALSFEEARRLGLAPGESGGKK
jgi:FixJ family two-component response regulator